MATKAKCTNREPVVSATVHLFRGAALIFALMLLICLPMIILFISLSPDNDGFFQNLAIPMGTIVKLLGATIIGFVFLGIVIMFRKLAAN